MTRNVLNMSDVDNFLKPIAATCGSDEAGLWLERTARRWILKHHQPCGRLVGIARHRPTDKRGAVDVQWSDGRRTREQSYLPDWLESGLENGVHWLDMNGHDAQRLETSLHLLIRYLKQPQGALDVYRLQRISLPDAIAMAELAFNESQSSGNQDDALMTFADGYRIIVLDSKREFHKEGRQMRHCAAAYWNDLDPGTEILSLRSPADRPCVTMEVEGGKHLTQVRGRANNPVAPRYRPYVWKFARECGLKFIYDESWAGIAYRSFDIRDPDYWLHQPWLQGAVLLRGADLRIGRGLPYGRFLDDLWAALTTMDDATLQRVLELHRGPEGRFAWFLPMQRYEVYGCAVTVFKLGYPWQLIYALQEVTRGSRRKLQRGIRDEAAQALYGFCLGQDVHLVDAGYFPERIDLDLSRIRHRRHTALRERIARQRRAYRSSRTLRVPEARMQEWEVNRAVVLKSLEERPCMLL